MIRTVSDTAIFEGYAAVFHQPDFNGDIVRPGAFAKKLIPGAAAAIKMLYQHKADEPIGRWLQMREDHYGLFVRGELVLDSDRARDVWTLLKENVLDGLSIGFRTGKARKHKSGRELLDIDLWEVSVVTFPMAPAARITCVERAPKTITTRLQEATRSLSR
jgi:hypothetical protein